jgi:SHS2 domain-containing protein
MPYEVLDHTADYMVEVTAESLPELFADGARALFEILTEVDTVRPLERVAVRVEADGQEQLLVSWLTELLFLYEDGRWLFCRFEPRIIGDGRVEADVWGEKLDPTRHPIEREVKAVTYHRMALVREGNLWKTTIVFDL